MNSAVRRSGSAASAQLQGTGGALKGLVTQFQGLFGASTLSTTALQGFQAAETGAAAGASSLALPIAVAVGAVVALGVGVEQAISGFSHFGAKVVEFQRVTNASARDSSAFVAVLDRFGISADAGARALAFMARNADANKEKLAGLGVTLAANADGSLNVTESFKRVADAVKGASDPAQKFQIIQAALGRGGLALLPALQEGSTGFDELAKKAKDAGLSMDENGVKRFKQLRDAGKDVGEQIQGLKVRIGGELAPAFIGLAHAAIPAIAFLAHGLEEAVRTTVLFIEILAAARHPTEFLRDGLTKVTERTDRFIGAVKDGTKATDAGSGSMEDYAGSADDAAKALDKLIQAQVDNAKATVDAVGAQLSFEDAQTRVTDLQTQYNDLLNRSGQIARDYAAAQREISKSAFDVGQAQRDAAIAARNFGVGSNEATVANERVTEALQGQSDAQQKLNDLNARTGRGGADTLSVAHQLAEARNAEKNAALAAVDANVKEKETAEAASGVTVSATEHAANLKAAYDAFAKTLAPGSELRKNIEDTGTALDKLASTATAAFATASGPNIGSLPGNVNQGPGALPGQPSTSPLGDLATARAASAAGIIIINNFGQPIDTAQAAALNGQQAAQVGGGTRRSLFS